MSRASLARRVLQGTALASGLTAFVLAAVAAMVALVIWQNQEGVELRATAVAFERAMAVEVGEHAGSLQGGAVEAMAESAIAGYRVEVWQGDNLLAANLPGQLLGPATTDGIAIDAHGWLKSTSSLSAGGRLVVATPSRRREALRVFGLSLAVAAPLCLGFAWLIGAFIGARATRPLNRFKESLTGAQPFRPLLPADLAGAPADIAELDQSFRGLWARLNEAMRRETEFASNASHELRLPLTRIRLRAERALAASPPAARGELREQIDEIDRMVRLVDSLLVMARDPSAGIPRAEVVNLADLVRGAAARRLPGRWTSTAEIPDESLVRGDEDLLAIAVDNLLDNAAKFSAAGATARLALDEPAGSIRFTITSPGARITASESERQFERFYRGPEARAAGNGYGLGLPLARHIARLHGGDVRCVSGPEDDAAFELVLPGWSPAAGAAQNARPALT